MNTTNAPELLAQGQQLANLWSLVIDRDIPTKRQILLWLTRYSYEVMEEAINALGIRLERIVHEPTKYLPMGKLDKLKYVSGCARNIAAIKAVS